MKKIFFVSYFFWLFFSCKSKPKFSYEENKQAYSDARNCLLDNYSIIFPASKKEQAMAFYAHDLQRWNLCKGVIKLFTDQSIEFVTIEKDSTITFFYHVRHGISSKQFFLMFVRDDKLKEKLTSDVEIVDKKDIGCYELMRVISLAN